MTRGHNIISVCGIVVPIGVVLFLVIFKLFGVVSISWWYVPAPLLVMVSVPFLMLLSPTGREIFERSLFSDSENDMADTQLER